MKGLGVLLLPPRCDTSLSQVTSVEGQGVLLLPLDETSLSQVNSTIV